MKFLRKSPAQQAVSNPKIERMTKESLIVWADNAIMYTGQAFDQWRFHGEPLDEVILMVKSLSDGLEILKSKLTEQ